MKFYVKENSEKDTSRSLMCGYYLSYFVQTDISNYFLFEYKDHKLSCIDAYPPISLQLPEIKEVDETDCVLSKVSKKVLELFSHSLANSIDDETVHSINVILETWYALGFIKAYGFNEIFDSRVTAWYNSLIDRYNELTVGKYQPSEIKKVESDVVIAAKEYLKYKPKGFGNSEEDLIEMFKAGAAWCGNM